MARSASPARGYLSRGRRAATPLVSVALAALFAHATAGCSDDGIPPTFRVLNGPTAVAFTCYGKMRVDGSGAELDSPMPLSSCQAWDQVSFDGESPVLNPPPAGQGPSTNVPVRLVSPIDVVWNGATQTAAVIDGERLALLDIDLDDGSRGLYTGGADLSLRTPVGLTVNEATGELLVADATLDAVLAIALDTGAFRVVSDIDTGVGPDIAVLRGIVWDSTGARALVVDDNLNALLAVDPASGDRTIVSQQSDDAAQEVGAGPALSSPRALAWNASAQQALVIEADGTLIGIDVASGDRAVIFESSDTGVTLSSPRGIAWEPDSGRALIIDEVGGSAAGAALVAIDVSNGAAEVLSGASDGATVGDGVALTSPGGVAWDQDNKRALVAAAGGIISVVLDTGLRELVADRPIATEVATELVDWLNNVHLYGFILQRALGTVAVFRQRHQSYVPYQDARDNDTASGLIDGDPFAPGRNVIPVGSQPVAIATEPSGCYVLTANAGSCDLSRIDVSSVFDDSRLAEVRRLSVTDSTGAEVIAKPSALVAPPSAGPAGLTCDDAPGSVVYLAYPGCNAVAAVDSRTGVVQATIGFDATGVSIGAGALSCGAASCNAASAPVSGAGPDAGPDDGSGIASAAQALIANANFGGVAQPFALHMAADGRRLYIGSSNQNLLTVVELGESLLPAEVWSVEIEGEVGITALAASEVIPMGGELNDSGGDLVIQGDGNFGDFQFVYAIATDNSVRVIEVNEQRRECDTQIDPRYLVDVRDGALLSCLPIGDEAFPRRAEAESPGIEIPAGARPLSLTMVALPPVADTRPAILAQNLVGHFAFLSLSNGAVQIINIDDDNYPDLEDLDDPLAVDISLAIAHQPRDAVSTRDQTVYVDGAFDSACFTPNDSTTVGGPNMSSAFTSVGVDESLVSIDKLGLFPTLQQVTCDAGSDQRAVPELAYVAPDAVRDRAFPDLLRARAESWSLRWEGLISTAVLGPLGRSALLSFADDRMTLRDGVGPFCEMGAEPGDLLTLIGCDPAFGDSQCRIGETCYSVAPAADEDSDDGDVVSGLCLDSDQIGPLGGACDDFLTSQRRFRVLETYRDTLTLGERRRVLRTTPVDGCADAVECADLYAVEQALAGEGASIDAIRSAAPEATWSCEPDAAEDPARADRNLCLMTCQNDGDCESGWQCSQIADAADNGATGDGYCVAADVPPAECVATLQRYNLRAGNAFVVLGAVTGFLHTRIADADTAECVDDPDAHPLLVGRIPLMAPPCVDDQLTGLTPNPCMTTVNHVETVDDGDMDASNDVLVERDAVAVRFRNPSFTFHLVDPVFDPSGRSDVECLLDGAACAQTTFPVLSPGYEILFAIAGGFRELAIRGFSLAGTNAVFSLHFPVQIVRGPLGELWIMDQGDENSVTRGRVLRAQSEAPDIVTGVLQ